MLRASATGSLFQKISTIRPGKGGYGPRGLFSGPSRLELHEVEDPFLRVERYYLGPISVARVTSTGHDVDVSEHLAVSLIVPGQGQLVTEVGERTFKAGPGEALLFSPNRRRTRVLRQKSNSFLSVPFIVPWNELRSAAETMNVSSRELSRLDGAEFGLKLSHSAPAVELIQIARVIHSEIMRGSSRMDRAQAHLSWVHLFTEKLVEVLASAETIDLPKAGEAGMADRHLRAALEFMQANFADIVTIADVANACGISVRTLEHAFKSLWGMTPHSALTTIRLDRARRLLTARDSAPSVTEAALACGFNHLGRFSAAYRARFGETPSRARIRV